MNETMPLELLSIFVAVAETRGFSAAAKQLGTSKATVSRAIARLEEGLGTELVHRTTRQVALSTAGTALYERAAPHLASLRQAVCSLPEREEEPSGELRLTAPSDVGATLLPEVVARFLLRHPAVRVDAHVTNRVVDLVGEGFDLAIRASGGKPPGARFRVQPLAAVELHLFASPTYLARRGHPRALGDEAHEWVLFRGAIRHIAIPARRGRVVCDDFFFLRELVRAGGGIGPLPTFLGEPLVAAGELSRVLPAFHLREGGFVLLYSSSQGKVARKVTAFRDVLLETLRLRPLTP